MGRGGTFGLQTCASHRCERGVDPELPRTAIEVATRLVIDIAGGTPGPTTEAVLPEHLPQPTSIPLRSARLARVLGLEVADAEVERILRALGLGVEANADGWPDRQSVVSGQSVPVRVDLGGRRILKKHKTTTEKPTHQQ